MQHPTLSLEWYVTSLEHFAQLNACLSSPKKAIFSVLCNSVLGRQSRIFNSSSMFCFLVNLFIAILMDIFRELEKLGAQAVRSEGKERFKVNGETPYILSRDLTSVEEMLREDFWNKHFWTPAQRGDMLHALEASQGIWKESAESSMEAYKACSILGIRKLTSEEEERPTTTTIPDAELFCRHLQRYGAISQRNARYASMDTNMGGSLNRTGLTPNYGMEASSPIGSPFSVFGNSGSGMGMLDVPGNLNWDAWDSYIPNGNPVDLAFQSYPAANIEPSSLDPGTQGGDPSSSAFGNGVFMGANTPGGGDGTKARSLGNWRENRRIGEYRCHDAMLTN
ncbi:fungal specific transcription factor domain-containing protein [Drepanopeziza brunnea f. sp. 'multigermtubi' MB_m1]|uniref:Fungal specific transcription factor domain-containing protein n=1 Tax=Marssonina brunnea f. sp. multigermtubi (strain MB_m1) TaxID=1072389 RepID=K1XUD8_MARBU|nr:fungal specific transcription factor domain-containing protein [Drepanopeziza brunnea f. sp. 'multigermtubi' MB_m1]EKD16299.1 fungal specific transcription factor domain-containing protein [Drepanopeziza brunnea f. sp. 'multigermtubi' MB_m1]